jgi:hypothetical protein
LPNYPQAKHVWLLDAPNARDGCRWFVVTLTQLQDNRYELLFKPVSLVVENCDEPDFEPSDHSAVVPMALPDAVRWFEVGDPKVATTVVHMVLAMIVDQDAEVRVEADPENSSLQKIVKELTAETN